MQTRKSSVEIKGQIKKYLFQGLTQSQIARVMNMSRQRIYFWIQRIRDDEQKQNSPKEE